MPNSRKSHHPEKGPSKAAEVLANPKSTKQEKSEAAQKLVAQRLSENPLWGVLNKP